MLNLLFWGDTNLHIFRKSHTKMHQKGNLISDSYFQLLENVINCLITQTLEEDVNLQENHLFWNAYHVRVHRLLDASFNGQFNPF